MKVTHYIAQFLAQEGVPCVFEMSGGMITHLLDSIHQHGQTRIISVHHEQSAAFAADAVGRITGIPGVAMATSGPGATNLLTGIGSCYFDSSPSVFITGQVNRHEQKGDRAIRQLGFQETDIVSMAKPITKAAWSLNDPQEVPRVLRQAFDLARDGRPGPVLLDIPMDVQRTDIEVPAPMNDAQNGAHPDGHAAKLNGSHNSAFEMNGAAKNGVAPEEATDEAFWDELWSALDKAQRPLILIGGGIVAARVPDLLRQLVQRLGVPVVSSLMAVDVLPYEEPLRAGWLGSYGNRWTNMAIGRSDFLLVLGSRLDVRQTGADTDSFKGERTIFHVDVETGEMNNRVTGCLTLKAHLRPFLKEALGRVQGREFGSRDEWLNEIAAARADWPDTRELDGMPGINPNVFMHQLSAASRQAAAFIADVGQHQMWAAQSLEMGPDQRFLTSGGMGSMGFALPAALGCAAVLAPRPVVVVAGDGGFQTNIQELQTVARNNWPIKMIVINNNCHGMVRQFQESYFDNRYQSTVWGYNAPDFESVARAYGIAGHRVHEPEAVTDALEWLWREPSQPALLEVMIDMHTNVYPKIAFGRPLTEMEPFAQPIAMEST